MKKVFYLSSCTSCKKILKEYDLEFKGYEMQDIKKNPLNELQIDILAKMSGSYENIFSKRAQLYKKYNLANKNISEEGYKRYLLEHYTFLKRPVIINGDVISCGTSKKELEKLKD